jgi:hypothetical protein
MKLYYECQLVITSEQTFIEISDELNLTVIINRSCATLGEVDEALFKMDLGARLSRYDKNTEILIENSELFFEFFLQATVNDGRNSEYVKTTLENVKNLQIEYKNMLLSFEKATIIS